MTTPMQEWQSYPLADTPEAAVSQSATQGGMPWQKYTPAPAEVTETQAAQSAGPSASDIAIDIAKQAPSGLLTGIEGMATAMPRILNAVGTKITPAIEAAVEKVSPSAAAQMHEQEAARQALMNPSLSGLVTGRTPLMPKSIADYLPEPQTPEGRLVRGSTAFVPAMMGAPGNIIRNAAVGETAGLASEGAGEATQGTAAEPYARVLGALAGGAGGARALAPRAAELTPQAVIDAGSAAYRSPEVTGVQIRPQAGARVSNDIAAELNRSRLNARLAPQTHAIVEDLATPVNGPNHSLEDFQTVRTLLGRQAGNFSNPTEQAAATQAIAALDRHVAAMPQSDLLAGNIADANATLAAGRGDYAAGRAAERVQTKLDNAELQAASAHSGGNIDNATRQKLRTILTSPAQSRGLTPEELDQIDQVVRGSPTGNALRVAGKALGGGGGLGALVTAAEGMHVAGPIGAAAPVAGYAVKRLGDALTTRAADRAVQQILSRAPSAAALTPAPAPALSPRAAGLVGALTAPAVQDRRQPPLASLPFLARWQGVPYSAAVPSQ